MEYIWLLLLLLRLQWCYAEEDDDTDDGGKLGDGYVLSDEKLLVKRLLAEYEAVGKIGRPVRNVSQPVVVEFGLGLIMMDIMEKENMMTMSAWTRYRWRDEYMIWDPAEFGGISSVKLPTSAIWMPDIMLYNTANTEIYEREVNAVINYDGTVTWYPHRIFHSSCSIDVKDFPFDNQTCHVWFGSWTHNMQEIDLQLAFPAGIDLSTFQSDYKETSKWDIEKVDAARMTDDIAVLTFTLHLRRRLMFSSYILTFPVVAMSFMTLLVFWLPADSSDKSDLGMTIFGSLLLLLLILVEAAPPTAAAVPMLGLYYCFNIVIVMVSIFLSSLVSKIGCENKESRKVKPIPKWIKKILFGPFAKALCLKKPDFKEEATYIMECHANGEVGCHREEEISKILRVLENLTLVHSNGEIESSKTIANNNFGSRPAIESIRLLTNSLNNYVTRKNDCDKDEILKAVYNREWHFLARVLDRIFLFLYVIVIAASLILLFPKGSR